MKDVRNQSLAVTPSSRARDEIAAPGTRTIARPSSPGFPSAPSDDVENDVDSAPSR